MTTQVTTADQKYYALMIDDGSNFDCLIEGSTQEELVEVCGEYVEEHPTHKILFTFHGNIIDLQNTIENLG